MLIKPTAWNNPDAEKKADYSFEDGILVPFYHINTYHALSQLIGYVKYTNPEWNIYFRGQQALYPNMRPSIFRKRKDKTGRVYEVNMNKKCEQIKEYIDKHKDDFARLSIKPYSIEPTLQHYGFKTKWIDLVDNIWVALWFGLYENKSKNFEREYQYVQDRRNCDSNGTQYFILIGSDAKIENPTQSGYYDGTETILIDLRKACPSQFIRPHSQHGLLLRRKIINKAEHKELTSFVACIIELDISKTKYWIGNSEILTPQYIYPSPFFDQGYCSLLEYIKYTKTEMEQIGSISHMCY